MSDPPATDPPPSAAFSETDLKALKTAAYELEDPGLTGQLADAAGAQVDRLLKFLPDAVTDRIDEATTASLKAALNLAVKTMDTETSSVSWDFTHKLAAGAVGVLGGAFGLPSAVLELPLSTTVMLRSIADIARANGEDLDDLEARLECVNVFALGGGGPLDEGETRVDEGFDSSYFGTRLLLARELGAAAKQIAAKGVTAEAGGAVGKLLSTIAGRYGVAVSEKLAAMAVPVFGAAAGATINLLFMNHFQSVARAHFTVRRLEREHGEEAVRAKYLEFARKVRG